MYVCGPTVYGRAHIGNARPAVVFDTLARLIRHEFGENSLVYARNVTDVDDKIIAAAEAEGVDPSVITERYERFYLEDMGALGVAPPDIAPHATQEIAPMIAMIERLIGLGHAYEARGPCAVLGAERSRLRRAQPPRPRGDDRRRAGRGRALQARSRRFRAVEAERRGRDRLGQPVGPRPARLAHRMLGDDRARISARRSTSTAAGSTSSSRTTRMRSRRAAAPTAARRSRASGCTTASSTWARRRCRRALGNIVTPGRAAGAGPQGRDAAAGAAVRALPPAAALDRER